MNSKELIDSSRRGWLLAWTPSRAKRTSIWPFNHFGVATEHALKAFLASFHPALLVDANDFTGLLHATGHCRAPDWTRAIRSGRNGPLVLPTHGRVQA